MGRFCLILLTRASEDVEKLGMTRIFTPMIALLLFVASPITYGADNCSKYLRQVQERVSKGGFNTKRELIDYYNMLAVHQAGAPSFVSETVDLSKKGGVWLDSGSGDTIAMTQFFSNSVKSGNMRGVAVTYDIKQENYPAKLDDLVSQDKITLLKGAFFENIPREKLGKADIITDLFGVFSYSQNVHDVLASYFDILNKDGTLFLFIADNRNIIIDEEGNEISIVEYFRKSKGVFVWPKEPILTSNRIVVRKISDTVTLPKFKLIPESVVDDRPPYRKFKIEQ